MSGNLWRVILISLLFTLILGLGSVSYAKTTINYWHYLSGEYGVLHESFVQEFNDTHPHIHVEVLYTGNQWITRDKLLASVAGGQAPEVSLVDQFWPPQMASTGALIPLSNFVDTNAYFADFNQTSMDTVTVDGEVWTMPFSMSNQILFYNKDMFREVGLDPEKPPTTWDELVEYAQLLTRDMTGNGKTDEWGVNFTTRANVGAVYMFITFLWQAGGDIYNEDFTETVFNSPEAVEALQFWIDLAHKYKVLSLSPPQQGFEVGRIAMQYSSTSSIQRTKDQVKFELGVAPIPAGKNMVTGVGGSSLAIFKTSPEQQAAAWEFVEWMSSAEVNLKWSMGTGYTPLRVSTKDSDVFIKHLEANPSHQIVMEQAEFARARPNAVSYADVSRILGVAAEEALYGNADPKKVLDQAVIEANGYIDSLK